MLIYVNVPAILEFIRSNQMDKNGLFNKYLHFFLDGYYKDNEFGNKD
jgi:hypothetical protein